MKNEYDRPALVKQHPLYDQAKAIAIDVAREFQPEYYDEPFEPHYWVIAAIIEGMEANK